MVAEFLPPHLRRLYAEARAQRHLRSPALSYLSFDLADVVEGIRSAHFPQVFGPIPAVFSTYPTLACVFTSGEPLVHIHHVLNHPETPREVIEFICKHELLHFVIPPRLVGKGVKAHPPEFLVKEANLCPEAALAWAWIWLNLGTCLRRRPNLERIDVAPEWKKLELGPRRQFSAEVLKAFADDDPDKSSRTL